MIEILKDKGKKITIFGYEYTLKMSLKNIAQLSEIFPDLENIKLNYMTIPKIMEVLIDDYCDSHPDAPRLTEDDMVENFDVTDLNGLQNFCMDLIQPKMEASEKNA